MAIKRESSPPLAGPSRPRKTARVALPPSEPAAVEYPMNTLRRAMEMAALVESLAAGSGCTPAWSCTNLLALPTPALPPTPFLLGFPHTYHMPYPLSITLTHFAGTPLNSSKGKATSRLSFVLPLPASPAGSGITLLSFAPCGGHLLAVVRSDGEDVMTVFEQRRGCINEWDVAWHEQVGNFGERGESGKQVVSVRWLGEARKWYPTPTTVESPSRPLLCAPHRSPPIVGSAFVLVLSTSEILFVHLPRFLPLMPLTLVLPLSTPLSLTALPTPPSLSTAPTTSPQNTIDNLVANLVDGMPVDGPSPSVVVGALGLAEGGGKTGMGAMKEELRAAERSQSRERGRVVRATLGAVRGSQAAELGETTFIIATVRQDDSPALTPSPTAISAKAALDVLGALGVGGAENLDSMDFGMTDFSALDEAFDGATTPEKKPDRVSGTAEEVVRAGGESGERRIELSELRIEMTAQEGPRLSIRPLSPVHLSDSTDLDQNAPGTLTHLEWLEDLALPLNPAPGAGSEAAVDLRLLAVSARASEKSGLRSTLATWALSNEPYALSEAFAGLECKKSDVVTGEREWNARRSASRTTDGLVSFVVPRLGVAVSSFVVGETGSPDVAGKASTRVVPLDASTLEPIPSLGETLLPASSLYSHAQISSNRALLCATAFGSAGVGKPVMAAAPVALEEDLPKALGTQLAIALVRQVDTSDLVGRVIGLHDEAATLATVSTIQSTLQGMLPPPRQLQNTPLQLELLGVTSTLYAASPGLALRGTMAYDIVQLAACVRAFRQCEKKDRGSMDVGYRCESDAVWPLIGYVKWYCDFCRELVSECGTIAAEPSPRLALLLHPFPRSHLLKILDFILGLKTFLQGFPSLSNLTVDLSRTVLDDAIEYNGLVLREWREALVRIGAMDGLDGTSAPLQDLLNTLSIPSTLLAASTLIATTLSSPALLLATPPTPPSTPQDVSPALDIIRRGRLPAKGRFRTCTKCGEKAERREEMDAGKWGAFEIGWEVRCACGGLWIAQG